MFRKIEKILLRYIPKFYLSLTRAQDSNDRFTFGSDFINKNKNLYSLIGNKFLNKKSFPYGKKINFNSIRKGEIIGEHEVKFSSGKEIITLNHEAFDRALYSDGALTAAKWLMKKRPGLYSMRDLLNFS